MLWDTSGGKNQVSAVRDTILDHLKSGGTITKIDAIYPPFSTTNLGDKILHLRRSGHAIEKRWKETPEGKKYAEYYLPKTEMWPEPSLAASDGSTGVRLARDS